MGSSFLEVLCNFYMIVLAVILPLYTEGSYWQLGDIKYGLFRNLSLLCLGLALCGGLVERARMCRNGHGGDRDSAERTVTCQKKGTPVDLFVLCYGGSVLLSALCSSYGITAWTGYREWYMGAVSQLLFVGIYFFVSRCYRGAWYPVYLWEGAFFLVMAVGLCNRLGLDPLGLMAVWNTGDWEYSHLLSTIGNINWFCGYCSVALAVPVAGYLRGGSRIRCMWLYLVSLLGLLLLCIQGSDSGLVCAAACLAVCVVWGQWEGEILARVILLAGGLFGSLPVYGHAVLWLGEQAVRALPADGMGLSWMVWWGWWPAGAGCLVWCVMWKKWGQRAGRLLQRLTILVPAGGILVLVLVYAAPLAADFITGVQAGSGQGPVLDASWGNGRGGLWKAAVQGFWQGDFKQKILGAGPDCFADYVYGTLQAGEWIAVEGRFDGAVFANAHNQWLNHLVNLGLLGVCCAIGLFVAAARRYRRYLPVVLALAMYGVHSLVSFQQVLSTPLFFLLLGLGESQRRRMQIHEGITEAGKRKATGRGPYCV